MITIKYKGVEITCTTADEAIEMIKKIDEAEIKKVTIPQIEPFTQNAWPDCDKCPNKPDPNKLTVGDSPCTWCRRNQFYCSSIMTDSVKTTGSVNVALESERCGDQCTDNRFNTIEKAKIDILENTNISNDEDEMKVLDNFLFRCWQMGWLESYEK